MTVWFGPASAFLAAPSSRALADEQLERAYTHGMALSLEKALDLALPRTGSA
jgi:hypothetical protein